MYDYPVQLGARPRTIGMNATNTEVAHKHIS